MVSTGDSGQGGALRTAIKRPVTVGVGVVLVVLLGGASLLELPIQVTPEVTTPTLSVTTRWRGASPVEVESEILEPQEEALKSIENLERMISTARADEGEVELELAVGTDLDEALVRVTNALVQVQGYPDAAEEPVVTTSNRNGPPLAVITITSPEGSDPAPYRTWVDDRIVPQIERIKGVSEALLIGGADTEIHVDFSAIELAARGLTIAELASRVGRELRDVSGGDLDIGKRRLLLRTPVKPEQPEELEKVVLGTGPDGTPILLGDVAQVSVGLRKATSMAMSDDKPSLVLLLRREGGSNVLEVTRRIRDRVQELQATMFEPEGLVIQVVSDQTGYIEGALDLVQQNLLLGAGLAVIVLLVFLRSLGASVIVALAIPVSVFGTALGMRLFGRSINVVSLAGITFAIGMVLDNSIVVLESIDTHRDEAESPFEAAYRGVREVWGAVLASTLTTAAVFLPIITWEGEVGQLLQDVAVAVAFAVLFSFVGSVFVIPAMAALLLRTRKQKKTRGQTADEPARRLPGLASRLREGLVGQVRWMTRGVPRALGLSAAAITSMALLGLALVPPLEYLPNGDRNLVFGILVPPPGYAIEELKSMGREVQDTIAEHTGVVRDGVPALERSFFVGNSERLFAGAIPEDPKEIDGVLRFLREVQSRIPGVIAFTTQASLFGSTIGGSRSIEIDIEGSDLASMTQVGVAMMGALKRELPGAQVRPKPSLDLGAPELHALPRRDDVAALQLAAADIGLAVDALVDGAIVGEYGQGGRPKLDVVLRGLGRDGRPIADPETLAFAPVATPSGHVVPLEVVASLKETIGPTVIRRVERSRVLTMEVAPPEEMPLEVGIARVESDVVGALRAEGKIPAGVELRMSGSASKLELAVDRFVWVLGFGVVVLFLVMAAVFEDLLAPLAVLMTLPLAAAGGILGLRTVDWAMGGQPLDLMTAVGFIILIGVVVNNAILVVDGSVARLKQGASLEDAVPDAVRSRVRPILMTTATSLAGLLPLVVSSGFGATLYRGVGAIVLGGLLVGTALTLYVIPAVFTVLWRLRMALASVRARHHGHAT